MADEVAELRAEVVRLKKDVEVLNARVWALADFFGALDDALANNARSVRADFIGDVRKLYQPDPDDREKEIQKSFRSDTFSGL